METRLHGQTVSEHAAHPTAFLTMVDRLKVEHAVLQQQLKEIRQLAGELYAAQDCASGPCRLIELQDRVLLITEDLDRHSKWEEEELFPVLQLYFNRKLLPSITPSIWVMEKDHELARLFVQSFIDGVNGMAEPIEEGFMKEMAAQLIQACLILSEHFTLEEELVFPMTDQLLKDLDYFYS
ncbi:hemerythrin domain-containing protein [Paenibacillus athensensis]|nr:hemerythrin domain-containing protein [Paenibacillus athensensis]MCD1261014.1 hemerythrin domain-containing protein [Paenibacillus athensensis]